MTDKVQKIKDWISKEQDGLMDAQGNFEYPEHEGAYHILCNLDAYIDSLQEEPVSIWHDAGEEPNDKSSCLIHYIVGGEVSYRDIFPVLYNKKAREFVSESYPHPTEYKVEQSSLEGGVVAEVYKNMRDRFPLSDIYKWAYIDDILNLSNVQRTIKNWKEPVSETNKVVQVRRCLEEVATTINPFVDEVIEQFNLKDKSIVAKEIQYRGVGLKGDFGENIRRSDDEVIYILKEDKIVGLIVIRRTEFNNAEITMVKTEERFKEKSND